MTPQRWAQIRQIFDGALDCPVNERAAYLQSACGRDFEMRREVDSLLQSYDGSGNFLEEPAARITQPIDPHSGGDEDYAKGYRVGNYQFDRRIGRGGMGSVWAASRLNAEFKQKVAIKVVKQDMNTAEILRRFRMERQVLASLDHPNIARLIDGGETPDGLPYLVMEYVEGKPINRYCEATKAPITERLRLFRAVCSAVQYAHQNLVIHRDIKASNILVTPDGVPKLLDFGIAKLVTADQSGLDPTETKPEMRPMTLDYASPEQVRGDSITTATDIYSLGVLLYRLLTNKSPYALAVRSDAAIQHAICEMEPQPPSSVVLTDEKSAIPEATQKMEAVNETRDKARKRLRRKLKGDLDMIILKALRKEPSKRYVSAEQFSQDIRRYLEGRPVIARSDTPGYRMGKFLRRNVVPVAVTAAAAIALLAGTWLSVSAARRSESARARDLSALHQTQHELLLAYARTGDWEKAQTLAIALYQANPTDPAARRDLAQALLNSGAASAKRKDWAEAVQYDQQALANFDALAQHGAGDPSAQWDLMTAADQLGSAQFQGGNLIAALASYSRSLQIAESLSSTGSPFGKTKDDLRLAVASANAHVGEVLIRNGTRSAGIANLRKALTMYDALLASEPRNLTIEESASNVRRLLSTP